MVFTESKNTSPQTHNLSQDSFPTNIYCFSYIHFLFLSPGDVRPTATPIERMRKVSWASFVTFDLHLVV